MNRYGLTLALAIFVSYCLAAYRAKKRGLSTQVVWDSLPWVLGFGILGARLYHVINYAAYYLQNPLLIFEVWKGGLGILGAVAGGLVGLLIYFKISSTVILIRLGRRRISFVEMLRFVYLSMTSGWGSLSNYLDTAAPAIILGQAIGRVGNLFNRENLPYAYWEILTNLTIFVFLILVERFVNYKSQITNDKQIQNSNIKNQNDNSQFKNSGYLFVLYLLGYSVSRFFLEFLRTDSPWIWGPLTVAQWVCLGIFSMISIRFWRHYTTT